MCLCHGHLKVTIRDKRKGDVKRFLDALLVSEYWSYVANISVDFAYDKCEANIVAVDKFGSSATECRTQVERWLDGVIEPITDDITDPVTGEPVTYRPFSVYATVPV
jgi:hypothetical protein